MSLPLPRLQAENLSESESPVLPTNRDCRCRRRKLVGGAYNIHAPPVKEALLMKDQFPHESLLGCA